VTLLKRTLSVVLCLMVSRLPVLAASTQHAGQINALMPAATLNDKPTKAKDDLSWNDVLKTTASGRVRAGLTDGSILSLGPNSELKVVQHDAASQQTSLEIGAGQLRSKVVKITQPGGKFEVKTPNAVIGVVGTDFYVEFANGQTRVICYTGEVWVNPNSGAHVQTQSQGTSASNGTVHLTAGQTVLVGPEVPPAAWVPSPTPLPLQQSSMADTNVSGGAGAGGAAGGAGAGIGSFTPIAIGLAVVGASIGVLLGTRNTGQSSTSRGKGGCGNPNGC
jgi:FecR protein